MFISHAYKVSDVLAKMPMQTPISIVPIQRLNDAHCQMSSASQFITEAMTFKIQIDITNEDTKISESETNVIDNADVVDFIFLARLQLRS